MQLVHVEVEDSIALVGLANPPLNLLSRPVLEELYRALRSVAEMQHVSVVVIRSKVPGVFSAGSDMTEFPEVSQDPLNRKILFEDYVLRFLERLPVPTIAEIDGHALGGGLELALACDLRVATYGSTLGLPEVKIGGLGTNGLVRLIGIVGKSRALDLVYTGRSLSGTEALDIGLLNRAADILPHSVADEESLARVISLQSRTSLRFAKRLASSQAASTLDEHLDEGIRLQLEVFGSPDLIAGSAAFLAKRPIEFPSHQTRATRGSKP